LAQQAGWAATVIDFNLLWHQDAGYSHQFYDKAVEDLLSTNAEVYGFTSMAVDTHVAMTLARKLKENDPACRIVVGGVHFSSIEKHRQDLFPWVDRVILGEAEQGWFSFLNDLNGGLRSKTFSGEPEDSARLDALPLSAYDLVNAKEYLDRNPVKKFDIEGGRGCRYKCSFCYSPSFYNGRRLVAPEALQTLVHGLFDLGVEHLFFVEDNFLNDPLAASRLCSAMRELAIPTTWSCYGTLPQLTPAILDEMVRSGCTGIFMGLDAVGEASEKLLSKSFLRGKTAWMGLVEACVDRGIRPTCAFVTTPFPLASMMEFDLTVAAAHAAAIAGADVRLNTLAVYPRTRLETKTTLRFEPDNLRVRLLLDVPAVVEECSFADNRPELFPFHNRFSPEREYHQYLETVHALFTLINARSAELQEYCGVTGQSPRDVVNTLFPQPGSLISCEKMRRRPETLRLFDNMEAGYLVS